MIRRIIGKIATLFLIVQLASVGATNAMLLDTEQSTGNSFSAGSVDIRLETTADAALSSPLFSLPHMQIGNSDTKTIRIKTYGSLPTQYAVFQTKTGGDDTLCSALQLEGSLNGVSQYTGSLATFNLNPAATFTTSYDDWTFTLTYNGPADLEDQNCNFRLDVKAWQQGSDGTWGLMDEETVENAISTNTAPVISNIIVGSPGEDNAKITISWDTNEPATSRVQWGVDTTYGFWTPNDTTADNTHHSVTISGLSDYQQYHFRVRSKDLAGNTRTSGDHSFTIANLNTSTNPYDIVINEFLPNPNGSDGATKPGGEWVELYNNGINSIDVGGWKLCDYSIAFCTRPLPITAGNTDRGDTIVPSNGYLVVYLDGAYLNWLNNTTDDLLTLYDDTNAVIDQRSYLGSDVIQGKTIARYPDGGINWFDPLATPGEANLLENLGALEMPTFIATLLLVDNEDELIILATTPSPTPMETPTPTPTPPDNTQSGLTLDHSLVLTRSSDWKSLSFRLENIEKFIKLSYELSYDTESEPQGVMGSNELSGQNEYTKDGIILGTCSTRGSCVYHNGVANIKLTVTLLTADGNKILLETSL